MPDIEHIGASRSGLTVMGIMPKPIGTLDEITALGFDPDKVACCARSKQGEVRGCPVWNDCSFHLPKNGGFKGKGPHYVGYRLDAAEPGAVKEDFCSCYVFTQVLRPRAIAGDIGRLNGQVGERCRIVAQEGEEIVRRQGVPEKEGDISPFAKFKTKTEVVTVPAFPRPAEAGGIGYERLIADREAEDLQREHDMELALYGGGKSVV